MNPIGEGLRMEHLDRRFAAGEGGVVHAVDDVHLVVRRGELAAVMGPSGSGKTTLLSLAGGLLAPTSGRVTVDGVELEQLSQPALTAFRLRRIGFVFQTFHLIDALTVAENVELPLNLAGVRRPASRERAAALIRQFGLEHRAHFLPKVLSGGEQQRVAIARALANNPPILLADEPTGSLDAQAGQDVLELLHAAAHQDGKAVLVVSHDRRICRFADQVVLIEDGRVTSTRVP